MTLTAEDREKLIRRYGDGPARRVLDRILVEVSQHLAEQIRILEEEVVTLRRRLHQPCDPHLLATILIVPDRPACWLARQSPGRRRATALNLTDDIIQCLDLSRVNSGLPG